MEAILIVSYRFVGMANVSLTHAKELNVILHNFVGMDLALMCVR